MADRLIDWLTCIHTCLRRAGGAHSRILAWFDVSQHMVCRGRKREMICIYIYVCMCVYVCVLGHGA